MKDTTEVENAWAAGLLEGEGSFFTKTNGHTPIVSCQMTDLDVLDSLHSLFGGNLRSYDKRESHHKQSWTWSISGDKAINLLEKILPYMHQRRTEKIHTIIETWNSRKKALAAQLLNAQQAGAAYDAKEGTLREIGERFGVSRQTVKDYSMAR